MDFHRKCPSPQLYALLNHTQRVALVLCSSNMYTISEIICDLEVKNSAHNGIQCDPSGRT